MITLALLLTLPSAPVPPVRVPTNNVTPGKYVCMWEHTTYVMDLRADHTYTALWITTDYRGTWHFDRTTRTLHITETKDGKEWFRWSVQDTGKYQEEREILRGVVEYGSTRANVSLRRVKR